MIVNKFSANAWQFNVSANRAPFISFKAARIDTVRKISVMHGLVCVFLTDLISAVPPTSIPSSSPTTIGDSERTVTAACATGTNVSFDGENLSHAWFSHACARDGWAY